MSTLAHHMRITGLHVSNDDVDSRKSAISLLKNSWSKLNVPELILAKAAHVAVSLTGDGTPSEALGKEVETAIQKKASAYLYSERPLEVGIVAGMAALELLATPSNQSGWQATDIWAAALWSSLGFQQPLSDEKREALRSEVLSAARERSLTGAQKARERVPVPDFGNIVLVAGEEGKLGNLVKTAAGPTIEALRRNASLDREELDFLWWVQLGRSRVLKRALHSMDEVTRVVSTGIEVAEYLRRMPCDSHREIVLRSITSNSPGSLTDVLKSLGEDRKPLAALYVNRNLASGEVLFPLITAILREKVDDTPESRMERSTEEWGGRALLEAALLKMRASGISTL